jgi:hypothetical protein
MIQRVIRGGTGKGTRSSYSRKPKAEPEKENVSYRALIRFFPTFTPP